MDPPPLPPSLLKKQGHNIEVMNANMTSPTHA